MDKTRVLFILGSGRSGSTILSNLLGGVEGIVSVGEVRYLWSRGIQQNRRCGCGERFDACLFWKTVVADAYQDSPIDAELTSRQLEHVTRMRQLPCYVSPRRPRGAMAAPPGLVDQLGQTYKAIADAAGARVVVDSSKLPTFGLLVDSIPGLEVTFVHLIRDPRAVAYSWQRLKQLPDAADQATMQRLTALKSSGLWDVWNATAYLMGRSRRYLRLRYEDFVAAPEESIIRVLKLVDAENAELPFTAEGAAQLGVSHTVAGNPSRMAQGPIAIRLDNEWEKQLPLPRRWVVTAATAPLLRGFGYRVSAVRSTP